jgi:hypothetical protein
MEMSITSGAYGDRALTGLSPAMNMRRRQRLPRS